MNNILNTAVANKSDQIRKYIRHSGFASIAFWTAAVFPALIGRGCDLFYGWKGETCDVSYSLYVLSGLLWLVAPAALFIIWILGHRLWIKTEEKFGKGSNKIILSIAFAIYLIYSNKYAGDLVNELFEVDSGHFGISVATFSLFYAPLSIYRSDIAKDVANFYAPLQHLIFAISILVEVLIWYSIDRIKKIKNIRIKHEEKMATFGFILICFSVWAFFAVSFVQNINMSLKNFIVWADFNEKHRCANTWLEKSKKVVFLDGSNVLALIEPAKYSPSDKELFLVAGPCTYESWKKHERLTLDDLKDIQFSWPTESYSDLVKFKPY